jgi:hypothetical protein
MKTRRSAIVLFVVSSVAFCVTAGAQTRKTRNNNKPTAAASLEQKMMQDAMPGPAHANLATLAGEYTTVTKVVMAPGAPPQESTGDAKLSMTLDGRFLAEDGSGVFFGQPTKSFKMIGYNNASKRYEGIWTYTMSTSIMTLTGTSNDGGKTINFAATYDDQSGVKQKLDIVIRQTDNDHFVVELNSKTTDGKPGPKLDTTYTRMK